MQVKIFYSWQSDLPNPTNRGFIGDALGKVAKAIHQDDSIQVEPVIDRDTQGVAGSPDITNTIFDKIKNCQIFVCDVSIINQGSDRRLTPNPNVLVELGYALGLLGWERVVLVINTAFGTIESLPFDLRMRRVINYELPKNCDKTNARKELEGKLIASLRTIVTTIETDLSDEPVPVISPWQKAMDAVENSQPNAELLTKKYFFWLIEELDRLFALYKDNTRLDLVLTSDDDATQQLVAEFADFSNTVALTKNAEIADSVYEFFSKICERYNYPNGYVGTINELERDFYRFLGYEMFVCFIAAFLQNNQWAIIDNLLKKEWYISNPYGRYESNSMTFGYANNYLRSFDYINRQNNLKRVSLNADVLWLRHNKQPLTKIIPAQVFMETDILLYLRRQENRRALSDWYPLSCLYLKEVPQYLIKAFSRQFATGLIKLLDLQDIDISSLRKHISQRIEKLREIRDQQSFSGDFQWFDSFDPQKIGTKS
jgi:hypothetical protein